MKSQFANPGKLTISRWSGGDIPDFIVINLNVAKSGEKVVTIKMDLESFAKAVTGLSFIACEYQDFRSAGEA